VKVKGENKPKGSLRRGQKWGERTVPRSGEEKIGHLRSSSWGFLRENRPAIFRSGKRCGVVAKKKEKRKEGGHARTETQIRK